MNYKDSKYYHRRIKIIIPVFALTIIALCTAGAIMGSMPLHDTEKSLSGAGVTQSRQRNYEVPILLYHNISPQGKYSINESTLRRHFELIKNSGYNVVALTDILAMSSPEAPRPPEKMIAITFDDGFKSMYTCLLPLVREYNFPVTLFVYTNFIAGNPGSQLTWDELRTMSQAGISIQCHSRSHDDLTALLENPTTEQKRQLFEELYVSRRILEAELEMPVTLLAFPYGYYSPELILLARQAGYSNVFSTDYGHNDIRWQNFCLRRHHILRSTADRDFVQILQ